MGIGAQLDAIGTQLKPNIGLNMGGENVGILEKLPQFYFVTCLLKESPYKE